MNLPPSSLRDLIKEPEREKGFHIFSNRNRREIFKELTRAPCQTSSSLSKKLGYDVQDVEWHLKKLSSMGFVSFKKHQKRVFYPTNLIREEDIPLFSLLNTSTGWIIVRSLIEKCRDINFLQKHVSRATAYRIVNKLNEMGLIKEMRGSKRLICLKNNFYSKFDEYSRLGSEFKKDFLEKIEFRGYSVEIIGTHNYQLVIRLTGIENFTLGIFISPLRTILEVKK